MEMIFEITKKVTSIRTAVFSAFMLANGCGYGQTARIGIPVTNECREDAIRHIENIHPAFKFNYKYQPFQEVPRALSDLAGYLEIESSQVNEKSIRADAVTILEECFPESSSDINITEPGWGTALEQRISYFHKLGYANIRLSLQGNVLRIFFDSGSNKEN